MKNRNASALPTRLAVLALMLVAAAPQRVSAEATSAKLTPPRMLPDMPAESHLDLGPVLLAGTPAVSDPSAELAIQADRLGADGFVFEKRAYDDVYLIRDSTWRAAAPGVARAADALVAVGAFLYSGWPAAERSVAVKQRAFYRAFRLLRQVPPPRALAELPLPLTCGPRLPVPTSRNNCSWLTQCWVPVRFGRRSIPNCGRVSLTVGTAPEPKAHPLQRQAAVSIIETPRASRAI